MFGRSLSKEVDVQLGKQAKLNEKSEQLIDRFLKEHDKAEIVTVIEFVVSTGAPKHICAINEFKKNFEDNQLSLKDVKTYLNLLKLHKDKMKEIQVKKDDEVMEGEL